MVASDRGYDAVVPGDIPPPIGRLSEDTYPAPDGSQIRLLVGERERASRASLCEAKLGPGQASRPVRHREVEEIWYFLEGKARYGAARRIPTPPASRRWRSGREMRS